jgi:hypothetical protein
MVSPERAEFLTIRAWHQSVVGGQDIILRRASALEHLQLFNGYLHEKKIDVYAKRRGDYENVDYHVVTSFDGIDHVRFGNVLCATASQAVNEMLADYDHVDETALIEGLAEYYHTHERSFDGLAIKPENKERFDEIKDWAAEYYRWR